MFVAVRLDGYPITICSHTKTLMLLNTKLDDINKSQFARQFHFQVYKKYLLKEDLASRVRGYHLAGAKKPLSQAGRPIVPCFPSSQPQQEADTEHNNKTGTKQLLLSVFFCLMGSHQLGREK